MAKKLSELQNGDKIYCLVNISSDNKYPVYEIKEVAIKKVGMASDDYFYIHFILDGSRFYRTVRKNGTETSYYSVFQDRNKEGFTVYTSNEDASKGMWTKIKDGYKRVLDECSELAERKKHFERIILGKEEATNGD